MSEYWKSTPKYWCKFCEVYIRDTGLERRNHEASGKHQGAIQRSLQKVHKTKQREEWEQQKAKSEVSRLNGLVGQTKSAASTSQPANQSRDRTNASRTSAPAAPVGDLAAQRRATAEQWLAMGAALPKELQEEATGTGQWQTVSERVVKLMPKTPKVDPPTSLPKVQGVHKRKADDDDEEEKVDVDVSATRKGWGSRFKSYKGHSDVAKTDDQDLDALLNNVTKKPDVESANPLSDIPGPTTADGDSAVKNEDRTEPLYSPDIKQEEGEGTITAPPIVTFKKRKAKR